MCLEWNILFTTVSPSPCLVCGTKYVINMYLVNEWLNYSVVEAEQVLLFSPFYRWISITEKLSDLLKIIASKWWCQALNVVLETPKPEISSRFLDIWSNSDTNW